MHKSMLTCHPGERWSLAGDYINFLAYDPGAFEAFCMLLGIDDWLRVWAAVGEFEWNFFRHKRIACVRIEQIGRCTTSVANNCLVSRTTE
jgi:hypothetical protein